VLLSAAWSRCRLLTPTPVVPSRAGLYAIGAVEHLSYGEVMTRIITLSSALNLKRRRQLHANLWSPGDASTVPGLEFWWRLAPANALGTELAALQSRVTTERLVSA
jgi:hypothetical protein